MQGSVPLIGDDGRRISSRGVEGSGDPIELSNGAPVQLVTLETRGIPCQADSGSRPGSNDNHEVGVRIRRRGEIRERS